MSENERSDDGLFDMDQVQLEVGQAVRISTLLGGEIGTVRELGERDDDGWPMVTVKVESGYTITCLASRVAPL